MVITDYTVCYRDEIEEKYAGKLMKEMSGLEYEIVSRVMKTLVNRKITVPGSFIRSVIHRHGPLRGLDTLERLEFSLLINQGLKVIH